MNQLMFTARIIALLSFVLGTSLFSLYLYFGEAFIPIGLGIGFIVLALIVNIVLFTAVVGSAILNTQDRKEAIKTCGIMLLNIPIAMAYCYVIISSEFPT